MSVFSNGSNVALSVAVYLATDHYDHDPNTISATGLLKPIRQIVLSKRVPKGDAVIDIVGLVKSRIGTSIHDGIEKAWVGNHVKAMISLGYPEEVANRIVINPPQDNIPEGCIPVYMEQRVSRSVLGVMVSGKYDFVAEGRLEDFKSTSTFTWTNNSKDYDYRMQGSIYRWLNPKIITEDHIAIQFLFTDWMPGRAAADPSYPATPTQTRIVPLASLEETEEFIKSRIIAIDANKDLDQSELPLCNDRELWRKEDVYKVYKDPAKLARCMPGGSFDNRQDAATFMQEKTGGTGYVREIPGEVIACKYCAAFPICTQKDDLIADGSLKL
jgi:hypothetical protein